jgi:hypothetical protein
LRAKYTIDTLTHLFLDLLRIVLHAHPTALLREADASPNIVQVGRLRIEAHQEVQHDLGEIPSLHVKLLW